MSETMTYVVPGMTCGHCRASVTEELEAVDGVERVEVDLKTKRVVVMGEGLHDGVLREAIEEAGYEAV